MDYQTILDYIDKGKTVVIKDDLTFTARFVTIGYIEKSTIAIFETMDDAKQFCNDLRKLTKERDGRIKYRLICQTNNDRVTLWEDPGEIRQRLKFGQGGYDDNEA